MASGTAGRRQRFAEAGQRRAESQKFEKRMTRISLGLILAGPVLGIGVAALGAAEVYPSDHLTTVGFSVMGGFVGLGLLVAACAGMSVLGGARAAPFGAILVVGFGVLVYGIAKADNGWRDIGVVLLMISCASFWVVPAAFSPREQAKPRRDRPITMPKWAGLGSSVVGGAVIAVVGHAANEWWLLLFGALSLGAGAGVGIALWLEARRYDEGGTAG